MRVGCECSISVGDRAQKPALLRGGSGCLGVRALPASCRVQDSRHAVITRPKGGESELVAIDLQTGEQRSLFVGPFMEMDVSPDGTAVAFSFGPGHMAMGLAVLKLEPPADPGGLPRRLGQPRYVVRAEETWHVHNGGWSPDSKSLVYTQDQDYGDIYELVEGG